MQQLGDGIGDTAFNSKVMDGEDVWVVELGDRLCLSLEPGEAVRILCHRFVDDLNRDVAVEPLIMGAVHLAHPAGADLVDDAVVAEGATDEVLHFELVPSLWYRSCVGAGGLIRPYCSCRWIPGAGGPPIRTLSVGRIF